jgi:hypothetical protein
MSAEKLEGLSGLVGEADAVGGPTHEQAEQMAEATADELAAKEWGGIAWAVGGFLSMMAPELKAVYTEERCLAWGATVVPVAKKYGWDGTTRFPELALCVSTMSLAVPTFFVIRARLAEDGGKPGQEQTGLMGAVRKWWRNRRAAQAAKVVEGAIQPAGGGHGGTP